MVGQKTAKELLLVHPFRVIVSTYARIMLLFFFFVVTFLFVSCLGLPVDVKLYFTFYI